LKPAFYKLYLFTETFPWRERRGDGATDEKKKLLQLVWVRTVKLVEQSPGSSNFVCPVEKNSGLRKFPTTLFLLSEEVKTDECYV